VQPSQVAVHIHHPIDILYQSSLTCITLFLPIFDVLGFAEERSEAFIGPEVSSHILRLVELQGSKTKDGPPFFFETSPD